MSSEISVLSHARTASWRDYLELCKPRVVILMVLTAMVGMCLATRQALPWSVLVWGNLGIALAAASAAVINHLVDSHYDRLMQRTNSRPIACGCIKPGQALVFSLLLCILSMTMLIVGVNGVTALLTFFTLIAYALVYTSFLKHVTVQNIVIGGAAGAAPPLLGWSAVTGTVDAGGLLLMIIIFVWTPPHFWSLAIHRFDDYAKANIPMLPNRFGIPFTKINILLYTLLLFGVTLLPFAIRLSGWLYLASALVLNSIFLYYAVALFFSRNKQLPMKMFRYSIVYLMFLFVALLFDHYY